MTLDYLQAMGWRGRYDHTLLACTIGWLYGQLLRYRKDETYQLHRDCVFALTAGEPEQMRNQYLANTPLIVGDRLRTVLIYLNSVDGGHTIFPALNISVAPVQGNMLLFSSQDGNGFCDALSEHAALAPKGTKYVLQRWYDLWYL